MKKNLFILCAALMAFGITTFGYVNWNKTDASHQEVACVKTAYAEQVSTNVFRIQADIDIVYNVDSRFNATITKDDLHRAKTVVDIVPTSAEWDKVSFLDMRVAFLHNGGETAAMGDNEVLNADQIKLLKSIDYSSNFYLRGKGKRKGEGPEGLRDHPNDEFEFNYYLTVVPEKEAEYAGGYDALISYLKESSKAATAFVEQGKLQAGRVHFTVTKDGTIKYVNLESTSGYEALDEVLIDLVNNMPEKWNPATNAAGENVDQEFVFFFGVDGC